MQNIKLEKQNSEAEEFRQMVKILFEEIKNLKKETAAPAKLLTSEDVMEILHVKKSKLYSMVNNREIPCVKIGGVLRFEREDLKKFIENKKKEEFKFEFNVNELKSSKYLKK